MLLMPHSRGSRAPGKMQLTKLGAPLYPRVRGPQSNEKVPESNDHRVPGVPHGNFFALVDVEE